jgi:hypothetical protein
MPESWRAAGRTSRAVVQVAFCLQDGEHYKQRRVSLVVWSVRIAKSMYSMLAGMLCCAFPFDCSAAPALVYWPMPHWAQARAIRSTRCTDAHRYCTCDWLSRNAHLRFGRPSELLISATGPFFFAALASSSTLLRGLLSLTFICIRVLLHSFSSSAHSFYFARHSLVRPRSRTSNRFVRTFRQGALFIPTTTTTRCIAECNTPC